MSYSVIIHRDWRSKRIIYLPDNDGESYPTFQRWDAEHAIEWDGCGLARMTPAVFDEFLAPRNPDIGDVFECDGRKLVFVEYFPMFQEWIVMEDSIGAHRLIMERLRLEADLAARLWAIRAYQRMVAPLIEDVQQRLFGTVYS